MLQDNLFCWKVNRPSEQALRDIYHAYKNDMLALAKALIRGTSLDPTVAEDVVQGG